MKLFDLGKRVISKKLGVETPKDVDHGLPLGAKVGKLLSLSPSPFVRAHETLLAPIDDMQPIVAISRLRMDIEGTLYRYYINKGDSNFDKEKYIQVYANANGDIVELHYFERLLRMYPGSQEELDLFNGVNQDGLGTAEFSLYRAQVEELEYNNALIEQAFGEGDTLTYTRNTPNKDGFVHPYTANENRVDTSDGDQGMQQEIVFMPYSRDAGFGIEEQLFISTEIMKEQNGVKKQQIHVDFMVGIAISPSDVTIL